MRRILSLLSLLATATSLAALGVATTPSEVLANNCQWGQQVYLGAHEGSAWDGQSWVHVEIDVDQTGDITNSCEYRYNIVAWDDTGAYGFDANYLKLRVWRCGSYYNTWQTRSTSLSNASMSTGWISGYGTCGPQADDYGTRVKSGISGSYYVSPYTNW